MHTTRPFWKKLFDYGRKTLQKRERQLSTERLEKREMMTATPLDWDPTHSRGAHLGGSGTWTAANAWYNPSTHADQRWISGSIAVFKGTAGTVSMASAAAPSEIEFETSGFTLSSTMNVPNSGVKIDVATGLTDILSGTLTGPGTITKTSAGKLVITGIDSAMGAAIIAGTLEIGNGGTTGSITSKIVNRAVLEFNRSNSMTYANVISGAGTMLKQGAGKLTLTGMSTLSGATTVAAGTLNVSGKLGTSSISTTGTGEIEGNNTSVSQTISGLTAGGSYELMTTWTASTSASSTATYEILDGTLQIATVQVNQKNSPSSGSNSQGNLYDLGTWPTTTGSLMAKLLSETNGGDQMTALEATPVTPVSTQYKITAIQYHVGEAENAVVVNNLSITNTGWITATSWQTAVLQAVGGSVTTSDGTTTMFPSGFQIGYVSQFANQPGNELLNQGLTSNQILIVLPGTGNDGDNGNYWVVTVEEQ